MNTIEFQPVMDLKALNQIAPVIRFIAQHREYSISFVIYPSTNTETLGNFIQDFCDNNELEITSSITEPSTEDHHYYHMELS